MKVARISLWSSSSLLVFPQVAGPKKKTRKRLRGFKSMTTMNQRDDVAWDLVFHYVPLSMSDIMFHHSEYHDVTLLYTFHVQKRWVWWCVLYDIIIATEHLQCLSVIKNMCFCALNPFDGSVRDGLKELSQNVQSTWTCCWRLAIFIHFLGGGFKYCMVYF